MTKEVLSHIRDLDENLNDWENYLAEISEKEFLSDRKSRHALLHCVLVSLQAAIDIGNHWVSELTSQRPESYRAIAEILREKNAIPDNLAEKLQGLFSLRNVLIHKYQALDLRQIFTHLKNGAPPLREYLKLAKLNVRLKKGSEGSGDADD